MILVKVPRFSLTILSFKKFTALEQGKTDCLEKLFVCDYLIIRVFSAKETSLCCEKKDISSAVRT